MKLVGGPPPLSNPTVSQTNEGNAQRNNAFVTSLTANQFPSEHQTNASKALVDKLLNAKVSELKTIAGEISQKIDNLFLIREETFTIKNQGRPSVYGELKPGKTEVNRDNYLQELINFYELKINIESVMEKNGISSLHITDAMNLHHGSEVYGDLKSLEEMRQDFTQYIELPNLRYNSGDTQFG